ncbi:hypothetical protein GBAR_LOCUS3721 [Geodia barretti]|uniref:VWFA domain-containing protein n=1 Tax=Geodia barretti TaxID=519541 RepID=A0AA35R486_GEOBA|nr:hypothetical protein GBAR_LOCUS3721 [Geodia barretti]
MTTNLYALNRDGGEPGGHILPNLLRFAEVLRRVGLDAGPASVMDMVRATEHVHIGRRAEFYQAARSIFVHRKQDLPVFDEAFNVFWRKPNTARSGMDLRSMGEQRRFRKPQVSAGHDEPMDDALALDGDPDDDSVSNIDLTRTYSAREVLREKDFAQFAGHEVAEARRMMASLRWDLGNRRTRRMVPGDGSGLDMRRTLRRSLQHGGEMLELAHRGPKSRPRSLALICDVSGSMERYTRMLLHFIHTIAVGQPIEAFLFATRLTRITRQLRYRSIDQAITEVSRAVPDWAGGTRIGEAVKTFNYQWLRRTLRGQSIVMIISDGWDRGEPELLARETSRLQRSCHRLIWLNPLLGSPSYQPLTQGMQAALPYVDDFLPVHNMNSLQALADRLSDIGPERGAVRAYRPTPEEPEVEPLPEPEERPIDRILPRPTFRHQMWGKER